MQYTAPLTITLSILALIANPIAATPITPRAQPAGAPGAPRTGGGGSHN